MSADRLANRMLAALSDTFATLAEDRTTRVVILRGAGRAFCAGHDLREMQAARAAADGGEAAFAALFANCAAMMQKIPAQPQPVIAQVHGIATAAGCQLVASCDMAVAATGTRFGVNGINISRATVDPYSAFTRLMNSNFVPPIGANWGVLKDDKLDAMINKAHTSYDKAEQTKALSEVHGYIVDQAYWVYIAHDLNPRAMSPKVKGFVQAQSWFQDLTTVEMAK